MDLGILFGFVGTWVLIAWALLEGGDLGAFVNKASFILVVGGSITTIFFAFPAHNVSQLVSIFKKVFFYHPRSIETLIEDLVAYAHIARRDGILSLEAVTHDLDDPFIIRGIQMAVDGADPEMIEQVMDNELDNLIDRHEVGKGLFETLGKYAPAYGMIGTLVGLVVMLQNMDNPKAIGPGMAVAILTTLYGAVIANAFALPIADRLARRSAEEVLYKTIVIKGVMAIQSGDNPRIVERKLRAFLPPTAQAYSDRHRDAA